MVENNQIFESLGIIDEEEDNWMFDSISRYDELHMFDLHRIAYRGCVRNEEQIMISTADGTQSSKSEIWVLRLPEKLFVKKNNNLVKNRDFHHVAAGFTQGFVHEMKTRGELLLTSESEGVFLYKMPSNDETDLINMTRKILSTDHDNASMLSFNDDDRVVIGESLDSIFTYDLQSQEKSYLKFSDSNLITKTSCLLNFVTSESSFVAVGVLNRGLFILQDLKMGKESFHIKSELDGDQWVYDFDDWKLYMGNSSGIIQVYDARNPNKILHFNEIPCVKETDSGNFGKNVIKKGPSNSSFSFQFGKNNIRIYSLNAKEVFVHDGHRSPSFEYITTHFWHPTIPNLIFSADNTGELQAWKYKIR